MFERSLVISQQSHASAGQRWTALASITVQVSVAAVMIVLPLFHPDGLTFRSEVPHVFVPMLKPPQLKPVVVRSTTAAASASISVPVQGSSFTAPRVIPTGISKDPGPPAPAFTGPGIPGGLPDTIATASNAPVRAVMVVATKPDKPLRISNGVSAGLLLAPIHPVYPAIAKTARVEGTVVVEAIISKGGTIESLHAVSGPDLLRQAAIDAIRVARYQPFKLNGEPTEVQTTITVNFRMQL
jgi:periplasmic protein TonB